MVICFLPLPIKVLGGNLGVTEMLKSDRVQVVLAAGGIQQVAFHHGVEGEALGLDAMAFKDRPVVFAVLSALFRFSGFPKRA